jgi:hypothetical protein
MAFHGDLATFPLPELLQWLDSSRKTGTLQLSWDVAERKLFLLTGQIMATASPGLWERIARTLQLGRESDGAGVMASLKSGRFEPRVEAAMRQIAEEELVGTLLDLTQAQGGQFHWSEDPERGDDEWVPMSLPLRHALFESLRRLDEAPDVERVLPLDTLVVRAAPAPAPSNALHRIVATVAAQEGGVTIGRLWLLLGLSRGVVLRVVYDLLRASRVEVDGAQRIEEDPVADMLEKGAVLLRELQFDAASLLFATLLHSDPGDRRVREFARMVEREHCAALYRELPPVVQFAINKDPSLMATLRAEERQIVTELEAGWDVSAIVLGSPQREVDALKLLQKLVRMGVAVPKGESYL